MIFIGGLPTCPQGQDSRLVTPRETCPGQVADRSGQVPQSEAPLTCPPVRTPRYGQAGQGGADLSRTATRGRVFSERWDPNKCRAFSSTAEPWGVNKRPTEGANGRAFRFPAERWKQNNGQPNHEPNPREPNQPDESAPVGPSARGGAPQNDARVRGAGPQLGARPSPWRAAVLGPLATPSPGPRPGCADPGATVTHSDHPRPASLITVREIGVRRAPFTQLSGTSLDRWTWGGADV